MKGMKIVIILLILIMTMGVVCAENASDDEISDEGNEILENSQMHIYTASEDSFTNLTDEIENAGTVLDLIQDYTFNNATDNKSGIPISKDNFILNGNGRIIDGTNQSRIFNITGNNITLSNLILIGGNAKNGGAIYSTGTLTLNNVTFADSYATEKGGAVALKNATLNCNNTRFIDNYAAVGSSIYVNNGNLNLYNSYITSNMFSKRGQIVLMKSRGYVENTTFINISASYTPALHVEEDKEVYIINSKFINLMANITAGALAVKSVNYVYIKDCEFINTTSSKNAGAVFADIAGEHGLEGNVTIIDTIFNDGYSEFGGAYLQLGGNLLLNNTEFKDNHAIYNGGSVYLSWVKSEINNCTFTSNGVEEIEGYPTYGGAIFSDISTLNIDKSKFVNNNASAGSAIYAYDTSYNIKNSLFENNTNPIYTFFDKESNLENNTYINDNNISTNNEYYASIVSGQGMQLTLINNTINVTTIPTSFDLRNYSWVTPVRDQGWMGSCWVFGMTSALESALLKATGINGDFSENNMQNTMIRYSIYGASFYCEGGMNILGISYLLSWLGAFPQDADNYDELGKISPIITTFNDIHIQDVMLIPNNEIPNGTQLKLAIMKYGALDVDFFGQSTFDEKNPYYNPDTYAHYVNVTTDSNHEVSVVGWDDNFPKEKFLITPPGDGAWIIKNSWGTDWGDNGYLYISYYDKSFSASTMFSNYNTAIIIENTEPYNKNYQYDLLWGGTFLFNPIANNLSYCNVFEALDDDLIGAVGTYFNQSDINYIVEIYVNDDLKLTQEGVSQYLGYHTIKLNEYVPIKKGDTFKAVITSNAMPYFMLLDSRVHCTENISFACFDGENWEDCYDNGLIACLKVYTVAYHDVDTILSIDDVDVVYNTAGAAAVATLKDSQGNSIEGVKVKLVVGDLSKIARTDANGQISLDISSLMPGEYKIAARSAETDIYKASKATAVAVINKIDNTLTIPDVVTVYNTTGSAVVATLKDDYGNIVSGIKVKLVVGSLSRIARTDENGQVSMDISGLEPGEYKIAARSAITDVYNEAKAYAEAIIYEEKIDTILDIPDVDFEYGVPGAEVVATLKDDYGNIVSGIKVKLVVGDLSRIARTDENGQVSIDISGLEPGEYKISARSAITDVYNEAKAKATATISKITPVLDIPDVVTVCNTTGTVAATLKDELGNLISGVKVKIVVGGLSKIARTDANGQVSMDISSLEPGQYKISSRSAVTDIYNEAKTTATAIVSEDKLDTTLTIPDVAVAGNSTDGVVATLKDVYGNVISGVKVKIVVGDLSKIARTDENGQVSMDISSLDPGEYRISARSAVTDIYNEAKTTATAIVFEGKIDTTLTIPDVEIQQGNGVAVATLKDAVGNVVSGVKVKIVVGDLSRIARTDANGQVSLDISSLAPGEYKISARSGVTDIYNEAKASAKATIYAN